MAIITKKINENIFIKAQRYLQHNLSQSPKLPENIYAHILELQGGADDGLFLDAFIRLENNRISIMNIWRMAYNLHTEKLESTNSDGETGSYAKILSQKYLSSFLQDLSRVDLGNDIVRELTITPELVQQIESDIDTTINPSHITESDITKYDRIEFIATGQETLIWFSKELKLREYYISFDDIAKTFIVTLPTHHFHNEIPLSNVVERKWKTGDSFAKALISIAGDMLVA